jgi:hypothetical protein
MQSWGWWIKAMSQQTGFININTVQSRDPELEQRIVEDVASYGRQLGWITEALDVVVSRMDKSDLTGDEHAALQQLSDLIRRVDALKGESATPRLTSSGIERMIDDLQALELRDRAAYDRNVALIRAGLGDAGEGPSLAS